MGQRNSVSGRDQADSVMMNGKVITVDKEFSIRQAVAVKDGRIIRVGTNNEVKALIGSNTKVLDIKGKSMLPGINDSHGHPTYMGGIRPPLALDLGFPTIKTIGDMVEILRKKVETVQPGEWIRGFGWDQGYLEECKNDPAMLPRRKDIDPVSPDNPVTFTDFSGHTLLVNSKALELAGITKDTPDPEGGEIERDSNQQRADRYIQRIVGPGIGQLSRSCLQQGRKTGRYSIGIRGIECQRDNQFY